VIKLRDVFVTPHHLNIVLELAEGGMLFDWVNARLKEGGGRMREDDARWEGCASSRAVTVQRSMHAICGRDGFA
jgi:hypothetical protein